MINSNSLQLLIHTKGAYQKSGIVSQTVPLENDIGLLSSFHQKTNTAHDCCAQNLKIDYSGWTDLIDAGIFINSGLVWQANSDGKRTKFAYMMMCVIPIS